MNKIKFTFSLIKDSFSEFMNDNCLKLSAALSYYTVFSLAPMLLVIISVVSFFYGKEAFTGELFGQISGLVGKDAAAQLQEIIKNAEISNKSTVAATVGVVTLLIGATGVFAEIQDSINYIWSIKSKPQKSWLAYLKNRLLSFSVILTLGFLLIVSLGVNTAVDLLSSRLERYFSEVSVVIFSVVNIALVLVILTALFTAIFKVLPDGHVRWKECLVGASFTAVMFAVGKYGISLYLGSQDLGAAYGASASIVILLTWVYYSSIILYFGAEFTKVYAKSDGEDISPNEHAVLVSRREVEDKTGNVVSDNSGSSLKTDQTSKMPAIPEEGKKVVQTIINLIDRRFDLLKDEVMQVVGKVAASGAFYVILGITGFIILVTSLVLLGTFLNKALDSDFLGYLILLVIFIIIITVCIVFQKNIQNLIRNILMKVSKEEPTV